MVKLLQQNILITTGRPFLYPASSIPYPAPALNVATVFYLSIVD